MEYHTELPIYMQVIRDLKKKIVQKQLLPGDKLPSSRELSVLYKINPNTAARVYKEMELMGYCFTKRGLGTFVTEEEKMQQTMRQEMTEELLTRFMREMKELGFQKEEILLKISEYKEEEL